MELKLLVLRTGNPEHLAGFYRLLGLSFDYHKHGNSPYHYSTTLGKTVLEIYPLSKNQPEADKNLRLGFEIDDFENTIESLKAAQVAVSDPIQTDFGYLFIVTDPDGRKIELYKSKE